MTVAFDSSALLAILQLETGSERAEADLGRGVASAVIFAETLGKAAARGHDPDAVAEKFQVAGLTVDPASEADARAVARLQHLSRQGISLADRFCLAHALTRGLPVLTSDRAWANLGLALDVRFFR